MHGIAPVHVGTTNTGRADRERALTGVRGMMPIMKRLYERFHAWIWPKVEYPSVPHASSNSAPEPWDQLPPCAGRDTTAWTVGHI